MVEGGLLKKQYDVVIVGGGAAGLSGALILGRCRRTVLVCDTRQPRNAVSSHMHGFLTRDGADPNEVLHMARTELQPYTSVELRQVKAIDAAPIPGGFEIVLEGGARVTCRKLMVATGLVDELPDLPGAQTLYGKSLFHCPYCDGWELRDQPLAVYDNDGRCARSLSLELRVWSDDIIVCTDGADVVSAKDARALARHGVPIDKRKIASIDAENGMLKSIEFNDGSRLARKAIFFLSKEHQHSDIPQRLGCRFTSEGAVAVGEYEATDVRGLYVAGNASHGVNLVIVAAAEGAQAAVAINESLVSEDLG